MSNRSHNSFRFRLFFLLISALLAPTFIAGCWEKPMTTTVSSIQGTGRRFNYQFNQINGWKCELWTGGAVYQTRSLIDITIQMSRMIGHEQQQARIRELHVKLAPSNSASPILERDFGEAEGKQEKPNVWVFQYDDLFSAPLSKGLNMLHIDVVLEGDHHWSTTVPIEVIASPGEIKGSRE